MRYFVIVFCVILTGCGSSEEEKTDKTDSNRNPGKPLFTKLTKEESGFYFLNEVNQTEDVNVLSYENYFNGAGVAIGDVNADGLPDIFMTGNIFGGRLYLNKGGMKFEQISETANIFTNGFTTDVSFVDINGDGYQDIYLCRSLSIEPDLRKNVLLINNKDNTFTDMAEEYGIADNGYSNQSVFFDYDNDGDLDLYVMNHRSDFENAQTIYDTKSARGNVVPGHTFWKDEYADRLYQNNGNGSFSDVTKTSGIINNDFSLSAVPADLNNDGYVDLYISNDFVSKDHAYINNGKGRFTDQLEEMFSHIPKSSMGTDIADFNNDGYLDVMNVDMTPEHNYRQKQLKTASPYDSYHLAVSYGFYHQISRNMLQLNNGDGTFSEIGQLANVAYTDWSWSTLFADFDNDGWQDIFISNGHYRDITDLDYLKYKSVEAVAAAGGKENINQLDLVNLMSSTKISNYAFRNKGDLTFENATNNWGLAELSHSNGGVYADLDLDGDLDLIVNNFNQEAFLYRNNAVQMKAGNYLTISLKGNKGNPLGFGTKVRVTTESGTQIRECTPYRGFESSVDPALHFGLGKDESVKRIELIWPTGEVQVLRNQKVNQRLEIDIANSGVSQDVNSESRNLLTKIAPLFGYQHKENPFIDFKQEPLLEHMLSNKGPVMATADVNSDGRLDMYIGGSAGQPGVLLLQQSNGTLSQKTVPAFKDDNIHEDGGAAFMDVNGDGHTDLYVSSGSNEFDTGEIYQDRLYLNDGKGNFRRENAALPEINTSTSCVLPVDFDKDGDLDLFVGGYTIANQYPRGHKSWLLKNDGGVFSDASKLLPNNGNLGIVNDAVRISDEHFIAVGEWTKIMSLQNIGGSFILGANNGLEKTGGLWNCIGKADFDGDGDMDLVVGNRGNNSMFKATPEHPAIIYFGDFDNNDDLDAFPTYYFHSDKANYTKHGLDQLFMQMKGIRKTFPDYNSFSISSLTDFIPSDAEKLNIHSFKSVYLENKGDGTFRVESLPVMAQFSFVQDILTKDVDSDGNPDIVLVGNNFGVDTETGKSDASKGLVMINSGKGKFEPLYVHESGFSTGMYDARQIASIGKKTVVVLSNNGPVQFYRIP